MTGPRPTQSTSNSNLDRLKSDRGVLPLHTAAEKGGQRGCYPCACTRPDGPVDPSKYAAVFTDECSRKTTAPRFMADSELVKQQSRSEDPHTAQAGISPNGLLWLLICID